mmetsp:Transcript_93994/g.166397  ORF Transcript_93994/g.166397 Transcript_93994/m.166397 type:complete len:720 (+) Transcript_93994:89-2248(+)
MQRTLLIAAALASCLHATAGTRDRSEHPIVATIKLLQGLEEKASAEGAAEEISYAKFEYWCKSSTTMLSADITERKENIDVLENTIDSKKGEVASLTSEIFKLNEELIAQDKSKSAAAKARSDATAVFDAADADLKATIDAVKAVIADLEGAKNTTEGSLLKTRQAQSRVRGIQAFLEMEASAAQLSMLHAFLGNEEDPVMATGDYEAHKDVYKFKSQNVIELFKDLLVMFETQKLEGVKGETNAQNQFLLATQALDNAVVAATKSRDEKAVLLEEAKGALTAAETEKGDEESLLAGSEDQLKTTENACALKESEWKERSGIRAKEIEAIKSAVEILSKVTGVRSEKTVNPTLPAAPVSALQMLRNPEDAKATVIDLLRTAARKTHAKALERLAMAISSKSVGIHYNKPGAFDEIINAIQKMIYQLQAEQTSDDKHKLWCDKELKKTTDSISDKTGKVDLLGTKIAALEGKEGLLVLKIAEDAKLIDGLTAHMNELTEIRAVGKKENAISIKDAEDAIDALAQATAVLEAFYKSSGAIPKKPWESFAQAEPAVTLPENPPTWGDSYTGVKDPMKQPDGIITILATVSEMFAKMVADTKNQDAQDQETFDTESKANKIEKARLTKESQMLTEEKKRTSSEILSMTSTKGHVQKELDAWTQYEVDLKPACVDGDSTYDDRKAARDEEIVALREAEGILKTAFDGLEAGKSALFLQIRRHTN